MEEYSRLIIRKLMMIVKWVFFLSFFSILFWKRRDFYVVNGMPQDTLEAPMVFCLLGDVLNKLVARENERRLEDGLP